MPLFDLALFQVCPAFRSADEALSDLDVAMSRAADAGANRGLAVLERPEMTGAAQ